MKYRLNLDFEFSVKQQLESLRKRTGTTTYNETIRKSLALYDLVSNHIQQGGQVLLRNKDKSVEHLRLL